MAELRTVAAHNSPLTLEWCAREAAVRVMNHGIGWTRQVRVIVGDSSWTIASPELGYVDEPALEVRLPLSVVSEDLRGAQRVIRRATDAVLHAEGFWWLRFCDVPGGRF